MMHCLFQNHVYFWWFAFQLDNWVNFYSYLKLWEQRTVWFFRNKNQLNKIYIDWEKKLTWLVGNRSNYGHQFRLVAASCLEGWQSIHTCYHVFKWLAIYLHVDYLHLWTSFIPFAKIFCIRILRCCLYKIWHEEGVNSTCMSEL